MNDHSRLRRCVTSVVMMAVVMFPAGSVEHSDASRRHPENFGKSSEPDVAAAPVIDTRPNIVLIMADDLDARLDTLDYTLCI